MTTTGTRWRKSSHSGNQGDCVELDHTPAQVLVRDSKNPAAGTLQFSPAALRAVLDVVTGR